MLSSLALTSTTKPREDTENGAARPPCITLPTIPELPQLTGSTIFCVGRRFLIYSPETILKLGTDVGEGIMTELAYETLGPVVPRFEGFVSIVGPPAVKGILIARQPGAPLVELWPTLSPAQRAAVKTSLVALLVRMRAPPKPFDYYGRPDAQPYVTISEFGPNKTHDFCRTRSEWDASRVRALSAAAPDIDVNEERVRALEQVQYNTCAGSATLVNSPVLTHGDLSDRNILVDPTTLNVTGLIDWELANVAPAYFEYAVACLCGGHDPEWRRELLEVLREVLRIECEREVTQRSSAASSRPGDEESKDLFMETLASWDALLNVE